MNQKYGQYPFILNGKPVTSITMKWLGLTTCTSNLQGVLKHFEVNKEVTLINKASGTCKSQWSEIESISYSNGILTINTY